MRKILFIISIIVILFPFKGLSQEYSNENGFLHYKNIDTTSMSKSELKNTIEKWCATNLNNSNYSVKLSNEDNVIVKTGFYIIKRGAKQFVEFTLDVAFKENKYKIEAYDFSQIMSYSGYKNAVRNPEYFTKDVYKKESLEMIESVSFGQKAAKKRLENPKSFDKLYNNQLNDLTDTWNKITSKLDAINISIKNSLQKTDSSW